MEKGKNNTYFLKIGLLITIGLIYLFGLVVIVDAVSSYIECECKNEEAVHPTLEYPGGSIIKYSCCEYYDECSYSGRTRCYDSTHQQVCRNYDSDPGLEWSSPQKCSGTTSCGYGKCDSDERPYWYCSGGSCTYRCEYNSSCAKSSCECSEGPCCDGCNYKSSTSICDFEIQTQYGCPWGSNCGADVAKKTKTRFKYCSGENDECTEEWSDWSNWSSWRTADSCGSSEVCQVGNSQCQYNSSCVSYTPEPESCLECESFSALMTSLFVKKEESSGEWEEEIKAKPGEKIDFLLVVANSSQEDFYNIALKVELPQEIIYKNNLKIGEEPSEQDITESFFIDSLSGGAIKTIVFKGEVSSEIEEGEKNIIASVSTEDLSIPDLVKVVFERSSEPSPIASVASTAGFSLGELLKKWYFWALLILGLFILFYLIQRFSSKK